MAKKIPSSLQKIQKSLTDLGLNVKVVEDFNRDQDINFEIGNVKFHWRVKDNKHFGSIWEEKDYCLYRGSINFDGLKDIPHFLEGVQMILHRGKIVAEVDAELEAKKATEKMSEIEETIKNLNRDKERLQERVAKLQSWAIEERECRTDKRAGRKVEFWEGEKQK